MNRPGFKDEELDEDVLVQLFRYSFFFSGLKTLMMINKAFTW